MSQKVVIVPCNGIGKTYGTVSREAAYEVIEELRPEDTVTICLPLFLAGGEGDRAFARFYPTIAVDGCGLRCAARATEQHSGKPAASVIVTDVVAECGIGQVAGSAGGVGKTHDRPDTHRPGKSPNHSQK